MALQIDSFAKKGTEGGLSTNVTVKKKRGADARTFCHRTIARAGARTRAPYTCVDF